MDCTDVALFSTFMPPQCSTKLLTQGAARLIGKNLSSVSCPRTLPSVDSGIQVPPHQSLDDPFSTEDDAILSWSHVAVSITQVHLLSSSTRTCSSSSSRSCLKLAVALSFFHHVLLTSHLTSCLFIYLSCYVFFTFSPQASFVMG